MKKAMLAALFLGGGCAPTNYYYSFDLTDPGAVNLTKPGQRDVIEDADVKAEMLVDPTTFQAIALAITNKTTARIVVNWNQIVMVAPDGTQMGVAPDANLGWVEPGLKIDARLVPFALPPSGAPAAAYQGTKWELDVPMTVRGAPKTYQFHMTVALSKI